MGCKVNAVAFLEYERKNFPQREKNMCTSELFIVSLVIVYLWAYLILAHYSSILLGEFCCFRGDGAGMFLCRKFIPFGYLREK